MNMKHVFVWASIWGLCMIGCTTDEVILEEVILPEKEEIIEETTTSPFLDAYNATWVETLGKIDPNHDWSAAMRVTAKNCLDDIDIIRIYTYSPTNPSSKLLADINVKGINNFTFDVDKSQQYIYLQAFKGNNIVISQYYPLSNKELIIKEKLMTRADVCNTTISDTIDLGTFTHFDEPSGNSWYNHNGTRNYGKLYYLDNVEESIVNYYVDDIRPILGGHPLIEPILGEGTNNREILLDKGCSPKVEFTTTEEGPIAISIMCGGTVHYNQIGYFYYKGNKLEDMINAPKYVLVDDARPSSNIKCNGEIPGNMEMPNWIPNAIHDNHIVASKKYSLVYFDPETNTPTYTFPQGIHIGFFIINAVPNGADDPSVGDKLEANKKDNFGKRIFYSLPDLNYYYNQQFQGQGDIKAITFAYGNNTYMGFEDGTDNDMNDVFFQVNGINDALVDFTEKVPEVNTWVIACEDLGSSDDYDFNDLVFSVSYANGTEEAIVTPLAAGGILVSNLYYNKEKLKDFWSNDVSTFHQLVSRENYLEPILNEPLYYPPLNVKAENGKDYDVYGYKLKIKVPKNFSITENMGGFTIKVGEKESIIVTGNKHNDKSATAPQMICVPEGWKWPNERQLIYDVYPHFKDWNQDQQNNLEWYKTIAEGKENAVFSFE